MGQEFSEILQDLSPGQAIFKNGSNVGGLFSQLRDKHDLCYGMESAQNFAIAAMSLSMVNNVLPSSQEMEEFIHQYLRFLTAHEVGHTLGLRHNFHASTMLTGRVTRSHYYPGKRFGIISDGLFASEFSPPWDCTG